MAYSLSQLEAIQKISDTVELQEQLCADLKLILASAMLIQCRSYEIPRTLREDESAPVDNVIPIPSSGPQAFKSAMDALSDWYADPQYSTKVVNRTPGAVVVSSVDEAEVLQLVSNINQCKAAIEGWVPRLGSRDDRFDLLRAHLPWLILPQLTRRLQAVPSSPALQSCTFTWGTKTEIKKVSIDEVCERLEGFRKRPKTTMEDVPWDVKIDREILAIRSIPANAELRWRRELRVRPLANLRYYSIDDEPPETYLREAHTPILILNPTRRIKLGTLGNYRVEDGLRRARLKDKGQYERVSDLMPIYLVKGQL